MITILGGILGVLGSTLPSLLSFFQDRNDKMHELSMLQMQIDLQKMADNTKLDMIQSKEISEEQLALYNQPASKIKWVEAYSASVRPSIAYVLLILYVTTKIPLIYLQFNDLDNYISIWGEHDFILISSVFSYYMGARSFEKMRGV